MNTRALPSWLERILRPKGDGKPVALVVADGALVDGEAMTLEDYRTRFRDRARYEIRVRSLALADVEERSL